jgi:hypothetical protein
MALSLKRVSLKLNQDPQSISIEMDLLF